MPSKSNTAEFLRAEESVNHSSRDELMIVVYDELRRLAAAYLHGERPNHTLQPTALVHEAYLRLTEQENVRWQNREHFIGIAAQMMRRILVNYAISHNREKRGGGGVKLPLAEAERFLKDENLDLVVLDEALKKFATSYPEESRIVELRFFGGLTIEETAKILNVSDSTVERDWKFARAWLLREMSND